MATVKLKPKNKDAKISPAEFSIDHANRLLKMNNSQWLLNDDAYKWNGMELSKNTTKKTPEKKE